MIVDFVVYDRKSGLVRWSGRCEHEAVGKQTHGDHRLAAMTVDVMPTRMSACRVVGGELVAEPIAVDLETERARAMAAIDARFGPMLRDHVDAGIAEAHRRKREQAERGGGDLIASEEERAAILAKAAEQDRRFGEIERERMRLKSAIRSAQDQGAIDAILKTLTSEPKGTSA